MMKPIILLLISCVTLLSLFTAAQGQIRWCPKKDTFPEVCGNNGNQQCLLDFLSKYGASSMPKNCACQDAGSNQRLCTCDVVCQEAYVKKPNHGA